MCVAMCLASKMSFLFYMQILVIERLILQIICRSFNNNLPASEVI
jgi:hypothetical protein